MPNAAHAQGSVRLQGRRTIPLSSLVDDMQSPCASDSNPSPASLELELSSSLAAIPRLPPSANAVAADHLEQAISALNRSNTASAARSILAGLSSIPSPTPHDADPALRLPGGVSPGPSRVSPYSGLASVRERVKQQAAADLKKQVASGAWREAAGSMEAICMLSTPVDAAHHYAAAMAEALPSGAGGVSVDVGVVVEQCREGSAALSHASCLASTYRSFQTLEPPPPPPSQ